MSAPQFTPGPWSARTVAVSSCVSQIGYAHQVLTPRGPITVGHSDITRRTKVTPLKDGYVRESAAEPFLPALAPNADAHLIAAAPELYEALQFARNELQGQFGAEYDEIDAALAKARGEQVSA